jgi:hypothetical protein
VGGECSTREIVQSDKFNLLFSNEQKCHAHAYRKKWIRNNFCFLLWRTHFISPILNKIFVVLFSNFRLE